MVCLFLTLSPVLFCHTNSLLVLLHYMDLLWDLPVLPVSSLFNLISLTLFPNRSPWAVPLIYSLSVLVSPCENLNIFKVLTDKRQWVTPPLSFCQQTIHHGRSQYHLVNVLFTPAGILLSQFTPDVHFNPLHPACTPLLCTLHSFGCFNPSI